MKLFAVPSNSSEKRKNNSIVGSLAFMAATISLLFMGNAFAAPGDGDGNGKIDLANAISALNVAANNYTVAMLLSDVNGDNRVGLEDDFVFSVTEDEIKANRVSNPGVDIGFVDLR